MRNRFKFLITCQLAKASFDLNTSYNETNLPIHLRHHPSLRILQWYLGFQHDPLHRRPEFDEHQSKTHELVELSSTTFKDTKLKPK